MRGRRAWISYLSHGIAGRLFHPTRGDGFHAAKRCDERDGTSADGFISPLDLLDSGLMSAAEAKDLHVMETSAAAPA